MKDQLLETLLALRIIQTLMGQTDLLLMTEANIRQHTGADK